VAWTHRARTLPKSRETFSNLRQNSRNGWKSHNRPSPTFYETARAGRNVTTGRPLHPARAGRLRELRGCRARAIDAPRRARSNAPGTGSRSRPVDPRGPDTRHPPPIAAPRGRRGRRPKWRADRFAAAPRVHSAQRAHASASRTPGSRDRARRAPTRHRAPRTQVHRRVFDTVLGLLTYKPSQHEQLNSPAATFARPLA